MHHRRRIDREEGHDDEEDDESTDLEPGDEQDATVDVIIASEILDFVHQRWSGSRKRSMANDHWIDERVSS